jgi:hypothetical protein
MITKEEFCKYIALIQDYEKRPQHINDVVTFVSEECKAPIQLTKTLTGFVLECMDFKPLIQAIKELIAKSFDPSGKLSESIIDEINYYLYGDTIDTPEMVYCKIQDIVFGSHLKGMVLDPCAERVCQKNNQNESV